MQFDWRHAHGSLGQRWSVPGLLRTVLQLTTIPAKVMLSVRRGAMNYVAWSFSGRQTRPDDWTRLACESGSLVAGMGAPSSPYSNLTYEFFRPASIAR
jgi:hypothetical protein